MTDPKPNHSKSPSLQDYVVRYDLATLIEEARLDYSRASAGAPRHLDQKDITARFRPKNKKSPPASESQA